LSSLECRIRPIDLKAASDGEYEKLSVFLNTLRKELLPDDPPLPLDEYIKIWKSRSSRQAIATWIGCVSSPEKIVSYGYCSINLTAENQHVADFDIKVLPELRRNGLGRDMLHPAVGYAKENGRRLMMALSYGVCPAGGSFLARIGARVGQEAHTNQLRIAELNHGILDLWIEKAKHLSAEISVGLWVDRIPEDRIEEVASFYQVVATDQPLGSLEMEHFKFTSETMREGERNILSRGYRRWILHMVEKSSGRILGLTEVVWSPNRPTSLRQNFTGVLPEYRNRGLGRWLKAEMLSRIIRERPEVELIRSGNADSNAAIVKINNELGFKPYISLTDWQIETAEVERYLATRN
jgi:mycothiol synthase